MKRKSVKRLKKILARAAILLLLLIAVGGTGLYVAYSKNLPTDQQIISWKAAEATRIYDRQGNLLYQIYGEEKRISVPSDQLSANLKEATVAIEDSRFYQHHGIDPKGIIRATIHNFQARKSVEGGSTITQQLAKNAYLTSNRTFGRKIREVILALKLERRYSKDEILTMYLNEVGYGSNAYGAEAAANMYFGKSAKDLTLAEAATLAAVTKSPTALSPYRDNGEKLVARRNLVLDKMVAQGRIKKEEADSAKREKLAVKPREEKISAPHFVMYVKQLLVDKYGEDMVAKGGLQVTTTLDNTSQKMAEETIAQAGLVLAKSGAENAGLVAIDPKTGEILAMVGSRNYFDTSHKGNVNVTTSARPPGSAFKPIIYGAAFEKGPWAPGATLFDVPTDFGDGTKDWMPQNYNSKTQGAVSIRQALAESLNIPAVKMMDLVGKDTTIDTAKKVGISTFTDPNKYGLALAIGGADVKLLDLAGAYGVFANNGSWHAPIAITKITQNGKDIYAATSNASQVFRPQVAYQINSILSDNSARAPIFGLNSLLVIKNKTVAAKTGTSQDYRDAWTIGYTPSLVAGVWVGNNNFSPLKQGSAGAMAAAPIWNSFMVKALDKSPDEPFAVPDGLEVVTVDSATGQLPTSITRSTRQDIYTSWQKPSNSVQYASYKVYDCDGNVVETRTGSVINSERPDRPNWQDPVIAWARANGYPTGSLSDVKPDCSTPPVQTVQNSTPSGVGGADILPSTPIPEPSLSPPSIRRPVIHTPNSNPFDYPPFQPDPND